MLFRFSMLVEDAFDWLLTALLLPIAMLLDMLHDFDERDEDDYWP